MNETCLDDMLLLKSRIISGTTNFIIVSNTVKHYHMYYSVAYSIARTIFVFSDFILKFMHYIFGKLLRKT